MTEITVTDAIADAIRSLAPGAEFAVVGNPFDGGEIIWHSPQTPQPAQEQIEAAMASLGAQAQLDAYRRAVQEHIDATARSRDYDNGASLAGYTASQVAAWKAEADAFVAWRDQVWTAVIDTLVQVQAGDAEAPESPEALVATLPEIAWP